MSETTTAALSQVTSLRSQYPADLLGVPGDEVLLSWQVESQEDGAGQRSAHIQASSNPDFSTILAESTLESDAQIEQSAPGGRLSSREVRYYRVRIHTGSEWSSFSPTLRVEAGLLDAPDITAHAIGDSSAAADPVPLLRKDFELNVIAQLELVFEDGSMQTIATDDSWTCSSFLDPSSGARPSRRSN